MKYFSDFAGYSFGNDEMGRDLFYYSGPRSGTYLIPDAITKDRLFHKQLWLTRIWTGILIATYPFLLTLYPHIFNTAEAFFAFIIFMAVLFKIFSSLAFHRELQNMKRVELSHLEKSRLGKEVRKNMIEKNSTLRLLLGLLVCLGFVASAFMFQLLNDPLIKWFSILFFGAGAASWG